MKDEYNFDNKSNIIELNEEEYNDDEDDDLDQKSTRELFSKKD